MFEDMNEEVITRLQELQELALEEGAEETAEEIDILIADYEMGLV